jgi:hypothetical protein
MRLVADVDHAGGYGPSDVVQRPLLIDVEPSVEIALARAPRREAAMRGPQGAKELVACPTRHAGRGSALNVSSMLQPPWVAPTLGSRSLRLMRGRPTASVRRARFLKDDSRGLGLPPHVASSVEEALIPADRLAKILKTTPCKVGKVYSTRRDLRVAVAIVYLVVYPSGKMVLKHERNILLSC